MPQQPAGGGGSGGAAAAPPVQLTAAAAAAARWCRGRGSTRARLQPHPYAWRRMCVQQPVFSLYCCAPCNAGNPQSWQWASGRCAPGIGCQQARGRSTVGQEVVSSRLLRLSGCSLEMRHCRMPSPPCARCSCYSLSVCCECLECRRLGTEGEAARAHASGNSRTAEDVKRSADAITRCMGMGCSQRRRGGQRSGESKEASQVIRTKGVG